MFWNSKAKTAYCLCQFRGRWVIRGMSTASSSGPAWCLRKEGYPCSCSASQNWTCLAGTRVIVNHFICLAYKPSPGRQDFQKQVSWIQTIHQGWHQTCFKMPLGRTLLKSWWQHNTKSSSLSRIIKIENRKNTFYEDFISLLEGL